MLCGISLFCIVYCISGIVCERKPSHFVDCQCLREKTFAIHLVIQLCIISFWKEITQENVHKSTKIRKIHEQFLSQMIPDIQYSGQYSGVLLTPQLGLGHQLYFRMLYCCKQWWMSMMSAYDSDFLLTVNQI